MHLMVCLDEKGGMSFFGRRQSMDRLLREKALSLAGPGNLWMDPYSADQFREDACDFRITRDPLAEVPPEGWFFHELGDTAALLSNADRVAVFRWNRLYPSDRRFPQEKLQNLLHREDFPGNSHETITLEVYQL